MKNKNKTSISVYGSSGFIGGEFCNQFPDETIKIPREVREPSSKNVLYFISTTHNYNVYDNPQLDIDTNLKVLIETLEACRKSKEDVVFNFISSWFVYGKTNDFPASENTNCNPRGFYSITKRAAERLLVSYCETFGIKYRILRLCNVYGFTDFKSSKKKNAMQFLVREVVNNRSINLYNGGEDVRDFMHVKDVVKACMLICKEGKVNEVFNVGSGIPTRFIEIIEYVKNKTNSKSVIKSIEPPEFHKVVQVDKMYLNVEKLTNLNFKIEYDVKKGLDELIEFFIQEKE